MLRTCRRKGNYWIDSPTPCLLYPNPNPMQLIKGVEGFHTNLLELMSQLISLSGLCSEALVSFLCC